MEQIRYVYRRIWNWIRHDYQYKVSLSIQKGINLEVVTFPSIIISNNLRLSTRMSSRWISKRISSFTPSSIFNLKFYSISKRETFIPYREGTILLASHHHHILHPWIVDSDSRDLNENLHERDSGISATRKSLITN